MNSNRSHCCWSAGVYAFIQIEALKIAADIIIAQTVMAAAHQLYALMAALHDVCHYAAAGG